MQIRAYRDSDCDEVVDMWVETKLDAYPYLPLEQTYTLDENRAFFRAHIAPRCAIWLGLDAPHGGVVGFLALEGDYLDRLYIRLSRQRQGIGEALLDHARAQSPARLRLHTHQENASARAFYEKHGFRAVRFGVSPAPESAPDVEYLWESTP